MHLLIFWALWRFHEMLSAYVASRSHYSRYSRSKVLQRPRWYGRAAQGERTDANQVKLDAKSMRRPRMQSVDAKRPQRRRHGLWLSDSSVGV
jgi:hypothetical protein